MDVFNQIAQAKTEQDVRRAIDNWFYAGDQGQDAEYVISHMVEHLNKVKEYSYYLQNVGVEQHMLYHLNNLITEVERTIGGIKDIINRKREDIYNGSYGDLNDEELKQRVINKLHNKLG